MLSISVIELDQYLLLHGILIGINLILLISIILRFEWPLIKKQLQRNSAESQIEHNIHSLQQNKANTTNSSTNPAHKVPNALSVGTRSRTLSPIQTTPQQHSEHTTNPTDPSNIQLARIASGTEIEEEKYIISYPPNNAQTPSSQALQQSQANKRRRQSLQFYHELFNPDNFDAQGKLLTAKQRRRRLQKRRISYRNDSINVKMHERPFRHPQNNTSPHDLSNHLAAIDIHLSQTQTQEPPVTLLRTHNEYESSHNIQLGHILSSRIYDDKDKHAVRTRYRYILYIPSLTLILLGIAAILSKSVLNTPLYTYVMYAYPLLQVLLSIVLWCEIDIVILSCGGAHIVEECLEVQISARGDEYKCIYCCCCNCAALGCCNQCTHDNGYSLFKCHHMLMKLLSCVVCPGLTGVLYLVSEVEQLRTWMLDHKVFSDDNELWFGDEWMQDMTVWWLVFVVLCGVTVVCMITALWVGVLLLKSLQFVSSLQGKILALQYVIVVLVTFVTQIQFVVLLVWFNAQDRRMSGRREHEGLCVASALWMLLVYVEVCGAGVLTHFAFRNVDFEKFGRDSIQRNAVKLFDFKPEFESVHDLHNYRRIYGDEFLKYVDGKKGITNRLQIQPRESERSRKKKRGKRESNKMKTPLITDRGVVLMNAGMSALEQPKFVKKASLRKKKSIKKQRSKNKSAMDVLNGQKGEGKKVVRKDKSASNVHKDREHSASSHSELVKKASVGLSAGTAPEDGKVVLRSIESEKP